MQLDDGSRRVEKYRLFCERESSIPLFSQAWWLDATAGVNNWGVTLIEKGDVLIASMPYMHKKKYGLKILGQPALTQTAGPWIREMDVKASVLLSRQKEYMQVLINQLPIFDHFTQNWNWRNTNWLPFYWNGFQQTTRYTYILHEISDINTLWNGFQENIRGDIKKAKNRFKLQVRDDLMLDDFLKLNRKTFSRQGMSLPYSETFVKRLDDACAKRKVRKIFIAEDEQGRAHAGVYIVWDRNSAYYLMGGGDPELRGSGATSLCMWEAIQFASTITRQFDFEGSMLEPVEKFIRGFGATQTPYFCITKTSSNLLKTAFFLREIRKGF
jgi:hypothetical protein